MRVYDRAGERGEGDITAPAREPLQGPRAKVREEILTEEKKPLSVGKKRGGKK